MNGYYIKICFNTQPPEGGWRRPRFVGQVHDSFNTQPPEGGWQKHITRQSCSGVSTHSRLKAAGFLTAHTIRSLPVSTHSRLKAAGIKQPSLVLRRWSFNTQPPEGGWRFRQIRRLHLVGFNTQPPEGGWLNLRPTLCNHARFNTQPPEGGWTCRCLKRLWRYCFNTQPPEGGWLIRLIPVFCSNGFNTQPPEGGWLKGGCYAFGLLKFQHTAA